MQESAGHKRPPVKNLKVMASFAASELLVTLVTRVWGLMKVVINAPMAEAFIGAGWFDPCSYFGFQRLTSVTLGPHFHEFKTVDGSISCLEAIEQKCLDFRVCSLSSSMICWSQWQVRRTICVKYLKRKLRTSSIPRP